jgi:hypothetical protein
VRPRQAALPVIAALAALAFVACGRTTGPKPTSVTRPLAIGETIGRVQRASAGTPESSVRTLLSVECKDGRLLVRTNVDAITADGDCAIPISQSTLDQMLGQPAVLTYTGDRLVIESAASSVKLELAAKNAAVGAIDGAP